MDDNRFPASLRLQKNRQFRAVYDAGKVVRSQYFVLVFLRAEQLKVGVVVSKKVGNAVVRNRLKRLMREAFRRNRKYIQGQYHIIMAARPPAAELKGPEAMSALEHLLQRAKFIPACD
ncbi:ribonuclease P protein component [Desulfurispirillum indicum S5]|uniref:Ribonuclease P protein component n=1 Tax=Desulfurispirillum indicum (strain ATCC BAA-1389 / DSM 22839 / S5) TaxID=653733 RepID=E6W2A6_DESIS|nr:ribonuclease P protein component [Desulfurispirillum indicum]ADU65564.1 ribonuclease P protein component [Desulfurispirillum indicum S5]